MVGALKAHTPSIRGGSFDAALVLILLAIGCSNPERPTPRPEPASGPNVLWIITDEQRTDSLGIYGSPWAHTPNLDRLGREGVVFRNAVTPAPVCVPARAAMLTGLYPSRLDLWFNVPEKRFRDLRYLTEPFHEAGYQSASFGKHHYGSRNKPFQTIGGPWLSKAVSYYAYADPHDAKDFDVVQFPPNPYPWILGGRFPAPASEKGEAIVVGKAKDWLEGRDPEAPFLLRVSFNAPHTPVVPPAPHDSIIDKDMLRYPPEVEDRPAGESEWIAELVRPSCDASPLSREQIEKARRYYYGEVSFVDSLVGELLDWMRPRGLLDNTIVVFVSDHGTHIGDFSLVQKQTFYEPSVKVPFLFWYPPGIASGAVLDTPVETRALMPTLLELAGLEVPSAIAEETVSLAAALREGSEPEAGAVFSEFNMGSFDLRPDDRLVMVIEGSWKLSLVFSPEMGDGALYNLADDPYERNNRYNDPAGAPARERLTGLIQQHLGGQRKQALP